MHGSSLRRMEWFAQTYLGEQPGAGTRHKLNILDVGSQAVAGGTYRQFFPPQRFNYIGLDLTAGPNVDIVPQDPYIWPELADTSFDAVISGQAFEHIEFFWLTALEMTRKLKGGGLMCLVAPRGFSRHRYPVDCYRFDADGMVAIARWCGLEPLHVSTDMAPPGASPEWHIENCEDSLLVARKPMVWQDGVHIGGYKLEPANLSVLSTGFIQCAKQDVQVVPVLAYAEMKRELEEKLAARNKKITELQAQIAIYENSNSWRITRPLRALRSLLRQRCSHKLDLKQ